MANQDTPAEKESKDAPVTPPPSAEGQSQAAPAAPTGNAESVMLKGEVEIFTGSPLPHLDQGPIKAYAAQTKAREKAFALICERNLVPQIGESSKYFSIITPGLPRLVAAGTVDWPPRQQQRYAFVYENKLGKPIANGSNFLAMNLKNDLVINTVVRNIVPAIKDMRDVDFVHGNIRVTNLYDGGGSGLEKVMLGECLSAPFGYLQPALYETIERAAADPLGRAKATPEDDMYALGVTLAVLLRGHDPMQGFTTEEVIAEKIEQGSYAAITGKERFTGSLLECLRGLLNDDVKLRWTIDDVITWTEGRRVHPKQSSTPKLKASRPLDFNGEKYLRPQMLSLDLPKHPKEAEKLISGKDLDQWLNRSLQDRPTEERAEEAINSAQQMGNSGFYSERLACYMSLALSPSMPMMFRGLSFMPEAFGQMLVDAVITKKDVNAYVEIIQNQMAMFWVRVQDTGAADIGDLITRFDTCRSFLRQTMLGYGIERCVYFMSPECHCLSDKVKDYYCRSAEELAAALEKVSTSSNRPETFFDRHIIAFLSVRDRQIIDPYIPDLSTDEKYRQILATLRVLAAIQMRSKLPPMPGLSAWLVDRMDPVITRFHDRKARTHFKEQLQKLKDKGDLGKLAKLFDSPQLYPDDFKQFKLALRDYNNLRTEYNRLEEDLNTNKTYGHSAGRQTAAAVSGVIATIIIMLYTVYKYSGGGSVF